MKYSIVLIFASVMFFACGDQGTDPVPADNNKPGNNDTTVKKEVVLEDTLSRRWEVVNATHNGSPDYSSKGLELSIRKDGSYTLISTGYIGTWEFLNEKTQVLLDKDEPAYKTTWTIDSISSLYLKVRFISPFTGGNAVWEMSSQ